MPDGAPTDHSQLVEAGTFTQHALQRQEKRPKHVTRARLGRRWRNVWAERSEQRWQRQLELAARKRQYSRALERAPKPIAVLTQSSKLATRYSCSRALGQWSRCLNSWLETPPIDWESKDKSSLVPDRWLQRLFGPFAGGLASLRHLWVLQCKPDGHLSHEEGWGCWL